MIKSVEGNIVDVIRKKIEAGRIIIKDGKIERIERMDGNLSTWILPGFVDAHVHVESTMVTPVEFSRMAVRHGTIGAVSDPHEIGNVMGEKGVHFMVENGKHTPFKFLFGAPSCVPATPYEKAGAEISHLDIAKLLELDGVGYLAEMMNFPGVIQGDPQVMKKIEVARKMRAPVDGHAPGLRGEGLKKYVEAGIATDHECTDLEEAREKIRLGMKILIREGSAAKNFEELIPLMGIAPERIMFCTDDCHPDELSEGHINQMVKRAISMGYDLFNVLRAASFNAIRHYGLDMGLLRPGDPADFIVVDDLKEMRVSETYIDGIPVYHGEKVRIPPVRTVPVNNFSERKITPSEIILRKKSDRMQVIEAKDGSLITGRKVIRITGTGPVVESDVEYDLMKIVVVNRYDPAARPAVGFISGFGIRKGAIASSIAHDSHNVVCVGVSDRHIMETIQWIFSHRGGIAVHDGEEISGLPLPIAGLMTTISVEEAGKRYKELSRIAAGLGTSLHAPFMTLSFMALLVIPSLKIGDRGLFDVDTFSFTSLFVSSP
ncbi:MAG: adenine deaminase [Bacteroidales bacterium]